MIFSHAADTITLQRRTLRFAMPTPLLTLSFSFDFRFRHFHFTFADIATPAAIDVTFSSFTDIIYHMIRSLRHFH